MPTEPSPLSAPGTTMPGILRRMEYTLLQELNRLETFLLRTMPHVPERPDTAALRAALVEWHRELPSGWEPALGLPPWSGRNPDS